MAYVSGAQASDFKNRSQGPWHRLHFCGAVDHSLGLRTLRPLAKTNHTINSEHFGLATGRFRVVTFPCALNFSLYSAICSNLPVNVVSSIHS